jgi:hypothetical protein
MAHDSNRPLSNDQSVINEGRTNALKDVDAPLRDQIVRKLRESLVKEKVGEHITSVWNLGNSDRTAWLERQRQFLEDYDEFVSEIYDSSTEWGSSLHLPTTLTVAKAYHARMQTALIGVNPPFTVKARKGANSDRAMMIQDLMGYTLSRWVNKYQGIDAVVDAWLWSWITTGVGIMKVSWHTEYSRYMDVETQQVPSGVSDLAGEDNPNVPPVMISKEVEVERIVKVCHAPEAKCVDPEDLLIVGGEGNPQNADYVIEQSYYTASDLWQLADQKVFNKDAVKAVIAAGSNNKSGEQVNNIKNLRTNNAGEASLDKSYDIERYQILEAHLKYDVDGSGINSDIIVWVNPQTREILAATYLLRRMPSGMRPFHKIDFHKRKGATYGAGIIELLYSLSKEIDAIHNITIDIGILSSQPFGFYRPTASLAAENLPLEPGSLVPLDNPSQDVYFPNLGNRTSFGFQEAAALQMTVDRFMSVSDITYGSTGSQGASRTATGTRALVQETNANLDVVLRRCSLGWKSVLSNIFQLIQLKIEPGFEFLITGEDGNDYFKTIPSADHLKGSYDFDIDPNSANSNKQIQMDVATQIYQATANPLDMQMGLVSPAERYEAIKNYYLALGVKNFSRFVRKPQGGIVLTPRDHIEAALAGIRFPITPNEDLKGIIELIQHVESGGDEYMGQLNEQQHVTWEVLKQEVSQMMEAMQAQQAQAANVGQQQANAQQANAQSGPQQAPQNQGAPAPVQA